MLPKNKRGFHAHIRSLSALGALGESFAAAVTSATLALWLETDYPELAKMRLRPQSRFTRRQEVTAFVDWLRTAPFVEAAFWLSTAYAHLVTAETRDKQALFFTPPTLSDRLLRSLRRQGVNFAAAGFVDPSCGGAAFLAPIATEIARELESRGWKSRRIVAHVERNVVGFEANGMLCELSQAFMNMALYEHVCKANRLLQPQIVIGDALANAKAFVGLFDVVISNPPYRKLTAAEFKRLDATTRTLCKGQPNLYTLFIALTLQLTREHGHIGLLTPAGFFGGRSFGPLRQLLRTHVDVRHVDFIEPRTGAFVNVEQETVLTVLRKREAKTSVVSVNVTTDGREFVSLGQHRLVDKSREPWVLPRTTADLAALSAFTSSRWRLADYGYTAKTGYLVPHRASEHLLRKKGQRLWVCPIIWATQIGLDGRHRFVAGRKEHANLYVKVSPVSASGVLTCPSVAVQRTSSKDQVRRVRCAPITEAFLAEHAGYVGENHVTFLVPLEGQKPSVSVEVLAAVLNTGAVDRVFRCLSGTATASAFELSSLPLPDPRTVEDSLATGASAEEAVSAGYATADVRSASVRKAA